MTMYSVSFHRIRIAADLYLYESQEVSSEEGENAAKEHGVVFFEKGIFYLTVHV